MLDLQNKFLQGSVLPLTGIWEKKLVKFSVCLKEIISNYWIMRRKTKCVLKQGLSSIMNQLSSVKI